MLDDPHPEEKETAFSSPMPFFFFLKRLFFGTSDPSLLQQIMIYLNLIIWCIFIIWHILSFYAIAYRDIILEEKGINVEILILNRGAALGFDPSAFMAALLSFHRLSIICWLLLFVSICLMWRKKITFVWFSVFALLFYYGSMFFYLGNTYYSEDTTLFDKISVIVLVLNSFFYYLLLRQDDHEGGGLFGVHDDEEDD